MRFSVMLLVSVVAMFAYQQLSAQSTTTATIILPYITEISPKNLTTGVDSTVVTIRGKNFQQGAKVFFNARLVNAIRAEGDSVLTVIVPGELTLVPDIAFMLIENPDRTRIGLRVAIVQGVHIPCRDTLNNRNSPAIFILPPTLLPNVTTASMSAFRLRVEAIGITGNTRIFLGTRELAIEAQTTSANSLNTIIPSEFNLSGAYIITLVYPWESCLTAILRITEFPKPTISRIVPSFLPIQGGRIIITGLDFSTLATVRLATTTLAIASISTTQIIVIVPPNISQSAFVTVTNPDGQFASQVWGYINNVAAQPPSLLLSPNPAHNTLTFTTTLNRASHLRCTLRTTLGAVVMEERHVAAAGDFSTALDVSAFPSGIYFLEVSDDAGGRWMQKVVKY